MDLFWKFVGTFFGSLWNWLFIILFVGAVVFFIRNFFHKVDEANRLLQESQKKLEKYNNENILFNFESLNHTMEKDAFIGAVWKKYVKTLVRDTHMESIHIYSTVDASDYFNVPSLTSGMNIGYWSGFAGVFTGVGILGTFLGLTVGLASVDTSSTNALSSSISNLLGGMSTAFVTSLLGIFCALPSGFWYSKKMNQFGVEIEKISDKLDAVFTRKNIEEIMLDQVAESRAQRTAIEHLSTDIADAICNQLPDVLGQIADRVNESLHGNIEAAVNGLLEKLQEQTNELKAQSVNLQNQDAQLAQIVMNTNALNSDVFEQFGKTINDGAGEEAKKVGNSLQKLSEDISRLSDNIANMIQKSQDTSAKVNASMLQSVEEALNKLDKTMDGILARQSQKTDENIQKMTELMEAMKQTMQDIFKKMAEATQKQGDNIQQATNGIKESTEENLNHINNTVKDLMAEIAQRMKEMQDMLETHERHFENTLSEMKDAVADSGKVLDKAKDTAEKWNNMADSSSSKLESAATSAAGMIEASATPFKQAVQPLQQATASMDGSLKTLGVALDEYNQKTKKTLEHMQSMVEDSQLTAAEIHEALEVTKKSWMAYQEQFQGVNKGMTDIFENLERGLEAYNKTTNEGMLEKLKMFDKKVGDIVDNLLTAYQESNDLLDDLNRNTKHMR